MGREGMFAARRALSDRRGTTNSRLAGKRREFVSRANDLMEAAGGSIKAELAGDTEYAKEYLSTLKYGASRECMDRTCIGIMANLYKLVGEERKLVVELVHRMGASSEDELRGYVASAKSVEGASVFDSAERCVAFLELFFNANPELRGAAVKRLGGYVPVELK